MYTTNIMCGIILVDLPVHTSVVNSVDQKPSIDEKNGLPDDDVKDLNIQPLSSKIQDVISIGSRYGI